MGDFTIFRKIPVFLKNSVTLRIRIEIITKNAAELRLCAYKLCSVTDNFRLPLKSSE